MLCRSLLAEFYFSKAALGLGLAPLFSKSAPLVSFLASLGSTALTSHLHRGPVPTSAYREQNSMTGVRKASVEKGALIP